jgi:hypothetical protein
MTVATKPRSEWSEAYRKRIESAERKGLTRQQARGHGSARREGRSEYQQRQERRIVRLIVATELPQKREQSEGEVYAELFEATGGSRPLMLRYLTKLNELMKEYQAYGPRVDQLLDELHETVDEFEGEVYGRDDRWFYYH